MSDGVKEFLEGGPFGVVGASPDRAKYGNKVLRCYWQNGRTAYPIHPKLTEVEGKPAFANVASLPEPVHGLSIITPPAVTERIVEEAHEAGIRHLWMQPGAESDAAIARAEELGMEVIAGGPCLLVVLEFRDV